MPRLLLPLLLLLLWTPAQAHRHPRHYHPARYYARAQRQSHRARHLRRPVPHLPLPVLRFR